MGSIDFKAYDAKKRAELKALEERWTTFLDRLEARVREVVDAAKPEARNLFETDPDPVKRTYDRFKDALFGQIKGVNKKAEKVYDEYIEHQMHVPESYYDADDSELMSDLEIEMVESNNRNDFYYSDWEKRILDIQDQFEAEVQAQDFEKQYQEILAECNALNGKFTCKQCGAPIPLNEIYFISTYIPCPQCQTQNTYEPSTKVIQLQGIARSLAEQRCSALEKEYKMSIYEGDQSERSQARAEALEKEREAYKRYMRAVHDEINKIIPALKEDTEKIYERMISDYAKHV